MNGFLYLCLLHFKKKMEQEDFNIREHQLTSRERDFENALRPLSFEDFSGQDKVVENLRIFVKEHVCVAKHSTTFCCTGLPDWVKQRFPIL